jgi:hypothetical protein
MTHTAARLMTTKLHKVSSLDPQDTIIRPTSRENALLVLREWLANNAQDYLKISDPYFGTDDMEVLQLVIAVAPGCKVDILTSKKHQLDEGLDSRLEEAYRSYWRVQLSDQDPPNTTIVIAGKASDGSLPVEGSWWLTNDKGLRLTSCFRDLGVSKSAELIHLSDEETRIREVEIDKFLQMTNREHAGERVLYSLFTL